MDLRIRRIGEAACIYLVGDMDVDSAKIIELIGTLIREGQIYLLLNFASVDSIDNNGLSILVIGYKYAVNNGAFMKLCNVPQAVRNILCAAHLNEVFEIYDDEEYALKGFEETTKINGLHLRRRFQRLELGTPVEFKLSISADETLYKARAVNMSGDGMFISSKKTFPIGSELDIFVYFPDEKKPVKLIGLVMWLADKDLQLHVYPGMGIEFTQIKDAVQKKIVDFVEKNIDHRTSELSE